MQTIAELKAVIGADIGGFQKGMTKVSESLGGVGKQLAQTGVALAGLGLAAGGAFLANGVVQAVEFEKSLKNIQAVTGASAADIATLGKTLNEIGGQSVAGPQAVADAYYDIAGGVADASVRLATLNAAIAVAEAGNADLAGTTKGMISVMNAYAFSAEQAGFVSDVFTQTVGKGVGTMDEFVSAMSPLGGLANSVGVEFDDLGKMMAFMTTKGTSAAESSTQIKAAMIALQKPSDAMKKAFKKLGAESGDALIKQYGLAGALKKVQDTLGDKTAFATAIGSTEALQAATVLATDSYTDFATGFEATMNGVTEAARAVQLQSVSAQFDLLKSQFASIAIDVGSVLLPAINAILGGINQFIQDVKRIGLGAVLQGWFKSGSDWLIAHGPAIFQSAVTAAMQLGMGVEAWVKANAPNIASGVVAWFRDGIDSAAKTSRNILESSMIIALQLGNNAIEWVKTNAPNIGVALLSWIQGGIDHLSNNAKGLLEIAVASALKLGNDAITWVKMNAADIVGGVLVWFQGAIDWLSKQANGIFEPAVAAALKLGGDAVSWVKEKAGNIGEGIKAWFTDGVNTLVTEGPRLVQQVISDAFTSLDNLTEIVKMNAPDIGRAVGEWLRSSMQAFIKDGQRIVADVISSIFGGGQSSDSVAAGETFGAGFGAGMVNTMKSSAISEAMVTGLQQTGPLQTALENIKTLFTSVFGLGPDSFLVGLFEGIFNIDKGTLGIAVQGFFGENGPLQTAVRGVVAPIQKVWDDLFGENGGLKKTVDTLKGLIEGVFGRMKDGVVSILKTLLSPLITLLKAVSLIAYAIGDTKLFEAAGKAALDIEGFKATGGAMAADKAYVVGEKGPEIVMPQRSSTVIPNNRMAAGGGTMVLNGPMYFQGVNDVVTLHDQLESEKRRRNR